MFIPNMYMYLIIHNMETCSNIGRERFSHEHRDFLAPTDIGSGQGPEIYVVRYISGINQVEILVFGIGVRNVHD